MPRGISCSRCCRHADAAQLSEERCSVTAGAWREQSVLGSQYVEVQQYVFQLHLLDDEFAEVYLKNFSAMEHPIDCKPDFVLDEFPIFRVVELIDLFGHHDANDHVPKLWLL